MFIFSMFQNIEYLILLISAFRIIQNKKDTFPFVLDTLDVTYYTQNKSFLLCSNCSSYISIEPPKRRV